MTETEVVREIYAAINRDDMPGVLKFFDPQIALVQFEGLPSGVSLRGYEEVKAYFLKARATWAEGSCEPDRFLVAGSTVLAFVHVRVKLKDNQEWAEGRVTDTFTFRNGKVTEMRTFAEEQQALEWVGVKDAKMH